MKFFTSNKYKDLTQLVRACQKHDPAAQTVFYDRYKSKLTGVCLRYAKTRAEADDIFQEAFIRIFNHINDLKEPEAADSWVKVTVIRTAINYYHRTTKEQELHSSLDYTELQLDSGDYEKMMDQLNVEELLSMINELPDKYRTVINLHLIDGYTHVEIGEMLTMSVATARSQFMRGRNMLLKKLEKKGIVHHENF
ncbi:RNA polymerase sigma factor [Dyadobacter arcticus]|uniref:RNA polymerase sigma-70 factor (ECF subfamily) n=1 Tax=Dyadobacter arcticus TaxID=1078754 RepID=A0ABX0ULA6_9BACT|nr:RNA polymerase sigma factor [Dyadobacter arcticus]NIJ53792.1 RNA polymerase sigma-70 factor (ECF subfamily) [Dyadobacter arcticus]